MRDGHWKWGLRAAGILAWPFLLLLTIETVARLSLGGTLQWLMLPETANPLRFSYLWLLLALVFLFALSNRIKWAAGLLSGLTILVAILHAGKERLLQQPLVLGDFSLLAMTSGVWSWSYFPFSWRHVLFFATGLLGWFLYCRYGLPDWRLRTRQRVFLLVASGVCFTYFTANVDLLAAREVPSTRSLTSIWQSESNQAGQHRPVPAIQNPDLSLSFNTYSFGLVAALLLDTDHRPEAGDANLARLSEAQVQEIWERRESCLAPEGGPGTSTNDLPHVVLVLSESFWDPTRLDGVAIAPDPLQNFRALGASSLGRTIPTISPIFGGYTCNAEFELLTGLSIAVLGSHAVPHRHGFRANVPSLPAVFRQHGYRTTAIHPFLPDFWNRDLIYPQIGFDAFIHIDTIKHRRIKGKFIGDDAIVDEVIELLDAATTPTFLFVVTMQNHSPYGDHRYGAVELETVTVSKSSVSADTVRDYVHGIRDADAMVSRLATYLAGCRRRTLLVFVGDHQPNLIPRETDPGQFTQAIRLDRPDSVASNQFMVTGKYEGLGLFWVNRGPAPSLPASTPLSLAALPSWILREANLPRPPLLRLSEQVFEAYPALCRTWGIRDDGSLQPLSALLKDDLLNDYQRVCLDVVFGDNHSRRTWARKTPE